MALCTRNCIPRRIARRRPVGFPGAHSRIPDECATVRQILPDAGWSTFWLGKDHNVVETDCCPGGSRQLWPLQKGFDRYYGFLGGETNNFKQEKT